MYRTDILLGCRGILNHSTIIVYFGTYVKNQTPHMLFDKFTHLQVAPRSFLVKNNMLVEPEDHIYHVLRYMRMARYTSLNPKINGILHTTSYNLIIDRK